MTIEQNLGKRVTLMVVKKVEFGVYLGTDDDKVLLPGKQVPEGIEIGDPKITLGEVKALTVADTGRIGAFLDWGLEKDLLLPFREQTAKLKKGEECLVGLYVDKSGRLCATMKVYEMLRKDSPYKKDDKVQGIIYEHSDNFGWFVAVDDQYCALIPKREAYGEFHVGERVEARVAGVKADGKLDLSVREENILKDMNSRGGGYPFTDKADAETIKRETGLSRNAFKRAVGRLLKAGKIEITPDGIRVK